VNDYCDLAGAGVLVTRPVDQSASLAKAIEDIGGAPHLFPGVEIVELQESEILSSLGPMAAVDMLIFVSPTAARVAMSSIAEMRCLPDSVQIAAVGQSTAAELKKFGIREIIVPEMGTGGDALLASVALQAIDGQSVLVVRGERGSDALASVLTRRGAQVAVLKCYRRTLPRSDFGEIEPLLRDGRISAWTATSGEILDNLFNIAGDQGDLLRNTPLFVNHPHVAGRGYSRAVKMIFVCAGGDAGLASGLAKWFCRQRLQLNG
jgi:uroporphyrinogen-III synthase